MKKNLLYLIVFLCSWSSVFAQKNRLETIMKMPDDSVKVDSLSVYGTDIEFTEKSASLRVQQEALTIAQKIDDKFRIARMLYKLGSQELLLERETDALVHLQEAYKMFEELKNYNRMIKVTYKMAQVFEYKEDIKSAVNYYQQTLTLAQKHNNEEYQAASLMSLANIKSKNSGEEKTTLAMYGKANTILQKLGNIDGQQTILSNMAGIYKKLKQYDKALALYKSTGEYFKKMKYSYGEATSFDMIGEIFLEQNEYAKAELSAKKALQILATEEGNLPLKVEVTNLLSEIYAAQNNYKSAFETQQKWRVLYDTLSNQNSKNNVASLQTKFATAQKEAQIKELDYKNETKTKQLLWAVVGLLSLGALLGLSIYLYQNLRKNKQKVEEQSNQLNTLMKELHHRVKNNLAIVSSLLMMQSSRLKDESAVKAVKEGQMRVDAMSLIHQRLYLTDNVSTLNIESYLTDLTESIMRAYGYTSDNFDLQIKVENPELDVDLAIPIGLIVNELVTNSFKYAYQGIKQPTLMINLKNNNSLTLEVQDNGIGFDEKEMNKKDSFGKKLIKGLSKQIHGECKFVNNGGTYFELLIPRMAA
jgi:two-component sensor histidine kinase